MLHSLDKLQFQRYRFALRCDTALQLDEFVANDLRGAFGFVLRHRACHHPQDDGSPCLECEDTAHCPYGYLFATRDRAGQDVARPYVVEPLFPQRTRYAPGETLVFNLLLVGRALAHLGDCIAVFQQLGRRGLGWDYQHGQGRLTLEQVDAEDAAGSPVAVYEVGAPAPRPVPPLDATTVAAWTQGLAPRQVALHLLSPLHLRDPQPPRRPLHEVEFHHLWDSLQQRLEQLMLHHCGARYQSEFAVLKKQALAVRKVEDSLRWQPQPRRTSKHQTVDMGGLLGHVVFAGDLAPFLPVLAIGEWLHLGHGCDLGNGRYRLLAA